MSTRAIHMLFLIGSLVALCPVQAMAFDGVRRVPFDDAPSSLYSPFMIKALFSYQSHAPDSMRAPGRGFGIGAEFARWFAETSYGSLVGVEIDARLQSLREARAEDGEEGDSHAGFELHPRVAIGIIPPRHDTSLSFTLLAGYMLAGWDDHWWDEGDDVRQHASLSARVMFARQMLEYTHVMPTFGVEPPSRIRQGFRRSEHRIAFRTSGGEDYGYAFTARYTHGVVRAASLASPMIDRQFMLSAGFFFSDDALGQ